MKPFIFNQEIQIVGPHGATQVDVCLAFSIPPTTFTPGEAMVVTEQIKNAIQHIVETARKTK